MMARMVLRTHYQVDEPAYLQWLVTYCTSAVRGSYREVVASKLAAHISARGRKFNEAAGRYAVDLARAVGLVTDQNTWTEKGHLIKLVGTLKEGAWEETVALTLAEKLLYFRLFLEADGAALLFVGRRLLQTGRFPTEGMDWNSLATGMFLEVYSEYGKMASHVSDRVALRNAVERLKTKGYEGKSGPHKIFLRFQTLHRLGLVDRAAEVGPRVYELPASPPGVVSGLETLTQMMRSIAELEKVVASRQWPAVAEKVFGVNVAGEVPASLAAQGIAVVPRVLQYYRRVMETGVPLCSLTTLIEALQLDCLSSGSPTPSFAEVMDCIAALQRERPKDVRLHVDRRGRPAFVKFSEGLLKCYS